MGITIYNNIYLGIREGKYLVQQVLLLPKFALVSLWCFLYAFILDFESVYSHWNFANLYL